MKHFKLSDLLSVALSVGFPTLPLQEVRAQERPTAIGELIVYVSNTTSPSIQIEATSPVHGSRNQGFPLVDGWDSYSSSSNSLILQFIDRPSGMNRDTIGYARYAVTCMDNYTIYIDYRDKDYCDPNDPPYGNIDFDVTFNNATHEWSYVADEVTHTLSNLASIGIWDVYEKGYPIVPVTIRNSFDGGQIKVAGFNQSSPFSTDWTVNGDSVSLEAISPQTINGLIYQYSSWSDGGAQTHSVKRSTDHFATTITANYNISAPTAVTNFQVGGDLGNNVHLSWTANPNSGVDYHVYRKVRHDGTMGSETYLATLSAGSTSWDDPDWIVASSSRDQLFYDVRAHHNSSNTYATSQWTGGVWVTVSPKLAPGSGDDPALPSPVPESFSLGIYPNPFNPTTSIQVNLAEAGEITLGVYDLLGREVGSLAQGYFEAGSYHFIWRASAAASGVYYARLNVANAVGGQVKFTSVKKLLLAK